MKDKNIEVWSIHEIWNKGLESSERRVVEPRDRMWATELAKQDLDIVLKLKGVQPTNEPNARALRKFEMGNIIENMFRTLLIRTGILQTSQDRIERDADDKHIKISGKLDFIAGGKPNRELAKTIEEIDMTESFRRVSTQVMDYIDEKYPDGLPENILEIKSISSYGFEKVDFTRKALRGHDLQLFHYCYNLNKVGSIMYISKDDARMIQIPILPTDENLKTQYFDKLSRIKSYIDKDQLPAKEKIIEWDEDFKKFVQNFNVRYSNYLTRNYGLKDESEYEEVITPVISAWNRIVTRIKSGKEMTDKNDIYIQDMLKMGYDIFQLLGKTRDSYIETKDIVIEEEVAEPISYEQVLELSNNKPTIE